MQIRTNKPGIWWIAVACLVIGPGMGCNNKVDDGLNPEQKTKANRLDAIAEASGGDWSKVPATDRTYILTTFTSGDEKSAQMLLLAKSGKMKVHPGGPPPGAPKH